ncbi:MAG: hypothetical protein EXS40_08585 [Opitutaceae bacterium]|nr:hypothetical protein [Opitutaceae bacterium]
MSWRNRGVKPLLEPNLPTGLGDVEQRNIWMNKAIADREGRIMFIKSAADDLTRANPHFGEGMKKIGQDK